MSTEKELCTLIRSRLQPIPYYDGSLCIAYPAAAHLKTGTLLPCVLFANPDSRTDLAIKRFDEIRSGSKQAISYRDIVENFVTNGNRVNIYEIETFEESPYALSEAIAKQIKGETSMGWTAFAAIMNDGEKFFFGTSWGMHFFEMPEGYTARDIKEIIPHAKHDGRIYRERPYFVCYSKLL